MRTLVAITISLAFGCHQDSRLVRRATMTPIPAPVRGTGQVADRVSLTIEGDNIVVGKDPEATEESQPGLWSPSHQVSGDIAVRVPGYSNVTFRGIYTHLFREGATNLGGVQIGDADGHGLGGGLTFTQVTGQPGTTIGIVAEGYLYRLPYVNGDGPHLSVTPGFAFGIVPAMKRGRFNFYGGLTLRNSPTIEARGDAIGRDETDPSIGGLAVVFSGGAELELISGLKARVGGHIEAIGSPVRYGPNLQAGVVIPLSGF